MDRFLLFTMPYDKEVMIRERLQTLLNERWPGHLADISVPPNPGMGDFSLNSAFAVAKTEHRSVLDVAREIADVIADELRDVVAFADVVAPGFVNVTLANEYLQKELIAIHKKRETYGNTREGGGKKVIVEYSAPNIAKEMHVGHLRSTIIGGALANVYEALGYDVVRWNFIGDWGTSFGKLIAGYKRWGSEEALKKSPIAAMQELYVRFNTEGQADPALEDEAREEFRKLEAGDPVNKELWERFREYSLGAFDAMYERLRVQLKPGQAVVKGESDYEPALASLIERLKEAGLATQGEGGALIADLSAFDISTPGMLRKSDGATVYLTRDVASLEDRVMNYAPLHAVLYVVANQQAFHFEQLFALAELMKQKGVIQTEALPQLMHIKYGLVLGADGKKFSTREGNAVPLSDVLDEAEKRSAVLVREKNPELSNEEAGSIAQAVGLAAIKYNDLRQHPHSDIIFDWDAMLDLSGNSGPYLQYTYARLRGILGKATDAPGGDARLLEHADERAMMRHLLDFPVVLSECAKKMALNPLALYLYILATQANRYYEHVRIIEDENAPRREARLLLIETVSNTLERGLELLGIQAPERI